MVHIHGDIKILWSVTILRPNRSQDLQMSDAAAIVPPGKSSEDVQNNSISPARCVSPCLFGT